MVFQLEKNSEKQTADSTHKTVYTYCIFEVNTRQQIICDAMVSRIALLDYYNVYKSLYLFPDDSYPKIQKKIQEVNKKDFCCCTNFI